MEEQYYIVRGARSGVFFGQIKGRSGQEITLGNVRRLWYWDGATETIQLAAEGVSKPGNCKFTMTVPEIVVLDALEIHPCSAEAVQSIKGVVEWKT